MIKLSALNDESEEESCSEEEVTKEALEQIALQQYAKALELQRKGNLKDATQLLKDLIDTELLDEVKKPAPGEKVTGPLFNLKYLCYKNLAVMLTAADDVDGAIEAYCTAAELDDTDVTLWHKLGLVCMRAKRFEKALHSFEKGTERNPRYWPCLDKIVTLLLGLNYKEDCISTIHDALKLDPGYLRGLAYRKYIYTQFPYIREYMEYLNPIYKWDDTVDEDIDEKKAEQLIKEANEIHEIFIEQQRAMEFEHKLPDLILRKPIKEFTWQSVGDSLVHMHHYMTENCYSHACFIQLVVAEEEKEEPMEVCEEVKEIEEVEKAKEDKENLEIEKNSENDCENDNNSDKDQKAATDTEKMESDVEVPPAETPSDAPTEADLPPPEPKRKNPSRRRGSILSSLQQWEWCNKRKSGRKKPANTKEVDDNIYDTLRKMVPVSLSPETIQKKENREKETSPELNKLFVEKDKVENMDYFGSENEQKDVKTFINKYTENKRDIIEMLKDYLSCLSDKWRILWPESLSKVYVDANKCYNNHIDIPACTDSNKEELLHYCNVNMLVEEFSVNESFKNLSEKSTYTNLSVIEAISITLHLKPNIFNDTEFLEILLRHLWIKIHINILNKQDAVALSYLYQLLHEFEDMFDQDTYTLEVTNFTFKPNINKDEILLNIEFLERNKKLSTVMDLYERENYTEVLAILLNSFNHCKEMDKPQEEEVSLDFAVQLSLILDTFWALDEVDNCFKWSLKCLHEALKYYFRLTTGSPEYKKWSDTTVKILCAMEHILITEGLSCLECITQKELSQGLEDLIRIIGHQVETNASEMPLDTVAPWIVMHYILQREEDQGRGRFEKDKDNEEVPNPLLLLFIGHEQLGNRGWCGKCEGKLLYFILDTVVPRLRSPVLSKCLEQVCQYMEQCVQCLFGHPGKKTKNKYLVDHDITPHEINWERAQQIYEIFRPHVLPALEGKITGISSDTEQLFHKILSLMPPEHDPSKYVPEIEKYIKGTDERLPVTPPLLPHKMRDIYFLLGDYYFKKEESRLAVKYNILDVIVNKNRLESWAEISLAKAVILERILNSCKNLNCEREVLNPAKSIIRCFKRTVELDPSHCNMWIEYGMFVYTIHSVCSRLLKQASESLSMEDFESLEKQKEEMLDTTQKCFTNVINCLKNSSDDEKNEDTWLHYYMLGKVAEKRNKPPSVYLDYYMKGVKSLQETDATYPLKINYNSPTHLCIEVLELHYRIHASILKYIEQHENKPISVLVGKVFSQCIDEWKNGPFVKPIKPKKDGAAETETAASQEEPVQHAANILKRSISDAGEEDNKETKRQKIESAAAKVRRSASYDTEWLSSKENVQKPEVVKENSEVVPTTATEENKQEEVPSKVIEETPEDNVDNKLNENKTESAVVEEVEPAVETKKKEDSSSSSSSSSSDSSSSDSSSESSDSESEISNQSNETKSISDEELMKIIFACLDSLEDCASRFPPHYKAIYRVAHYHFYYKKGKDIERCRDLMLSTFTSRNGQKLLGLFCERKNSNFFNNIWKIPHSEVDRAGGFAFHMSRSILLTMEILKEIDDHKTLLDLSLYLQRVPDMDKTYLRDSDREELAQQAFSLCVQSLKGQVTKFSQQPDLKSNAVEQKALKSLMLDIYRAYMKVQKQPNSKQFTNLLVEAFKLITTDTITESMNLVDLSMKFCQKLLQQLKYEATLASLDKSQNTQKKQSTKQPVEVQKPLPPPVTTATTKAEVVKPTATSSSSSLPKMSAHEMAAAFQNYIPMLNDPMLSQQTAAALSLSYLSNMNALAGYSLQKSLQASLQNTLQNSFQAEFYRQFLEQSFQPYMPQKKQRGPKPSSSRPPLPKPKSFTGAVTKAAPTPVITSLQKSASMSMAPSMGTVLPNLPASLTANLVSFGSSHHSSSHGASSHSKSHSSQQVSPSKTLQEKLAERQKHTHVPKSSSQEINASISKLPSSLTITKTSASKTNPKKPEAKKSLPFSERPKPITTDEVIVLDDD